MLKKLFMFVVLLISVSVWAYVPTSDMPNNTTSNIPTAQNDKFVQMIHQKTSDAMKTFNNVSYDKLSHGNKEDFFAQDNANTDTHSSWRSFKIGKKHG